MMKVTIETCQRRSSPRDLGDGELEKLVCDNFAGASANLTLAYLGTVLGSDNKVLGVHGIGDGAVVMVE